MEILKMVLTILEVIASVVLVVVILLQSGKEAGIGAISGKNETYLSKSKNGSLDKFWLLPPSGSLWPGLC